MATTYSFICDLKTFFENFFQSFILRSDLKDNVMQSHVNKTVSPPRHMLMWLLLCRFCLPLPQLTPDYDRVVVIGLLTPDSTKFNMLHTIKLIQMISEIRISEDYCISDVYVFDYANVSLGHLPKITPSYLKKTETCAIVSSINFARLSNNTNN